MRTPIRNHNIYINRLERRNGVIRFMKPKTLKITYWVVTILFSLMMLVGAITGLMGTEQSIAIMTALGYPAYVLTIISFAKVLGIIGILQNKFSTLKEWAYAGFTIDILGAAASQAFMGMGVGTVASTLIFLVVMFVSYYLWNTTSTPAPKHK